MPSSTLPDVPIKFNMLLTDIPGPLGVPLAHMKWRIVHAPTQQDAHLAKTALLSGETGPDGKITLTTGQEKLLATAYRKTPSQIWLAYGGQIKSLQLAQTQEDWSDRDKFYHALDAMGYSDQLYLAQQDDVDNTVGPRARQELKSGSGATILNKLKA
jgi:type VI secretion system secreted protein VgrG